MPSKTKKPVAANGDGDVTGPGSSTDNAIVRFNGAGGKTIQNSVVIADDSGNVTVPANIALGGAAINANRFANIDVSITAGATTDGVYSKIVSDGNKILRNYFEVRETGAGTTSQLRGGYFWAMNDGAGTITSANGFYSLCQNDAGGTIDDGRGVDAYVYNRLGGEITAAYAYRGTIFNTNASGTMTNAYGISIANLVNSGTIANTYAIHVGDITAGTQTNTAFNIYLSDGNAINYLNGNTGIGIDAPDNTFHVHKASAGAVVTSGSTIVSIENNTTNGLSLLQPDADFGYIVWGCPTDDTAAYFRFKQSTGKMEIATALASGNMTIGTANNVVAVTINNTQHVIISTALVLPNGAGGTTVDAVGEICVDSTSKTLNFHDGTAEVALESLISKSFYLEDPVAADEIPLIRFEKASTLVKVVYAVSAVGTNWIGQIQEADDAQGTSAADTQAADSTVTGNTEVTAFSNATFGAGDYAYLKTTSVSGAIAWLHVTFYYRQDV